MKLEQRARKFLGRDSDAEEFQVTRSEGSCVFDANGKRYIDFLAGWCVDNLGWSNADIERALRAATKTTYAYPYYLYRPWNAAPADKEVNVPMLVQGASTFAVGAANHAES